MKTDTMSDSHSYFIEEYQVTEEPFYVPVADEVQLFEAAYKQKIPVLLKGPTGCGKTRFVEYMAYRLGIELTKVSKSEDGLNLPLVTIACHEEVIDLIHHFMRIT